MTLNHSMGTYLLGSMLWGTLLAPDIAVAKEALPKETVDSADLQRAEPRDAADTTQPEQEGPSIEEHRVPFNVLVDRLIGSASKPVRFDWRNTSVGLAVVGSSVLELNNFASGRLGAVARSPVGPFMGELGLVWAATWGSESTATLARTPYRQHARPSRLELDVNLSFPLAEGVVTAWPGFFPAVEMVFSASAGFRYLYYHGSLKGAKAGEVFRTILSPTLSDREVENLDGRRLPGMAIDRARYSLLLGFTTDIYFSNGFFVSPRTLLALPLFRSLAGGLGTWWEISLGIGWAF